MIKLIIPFAGCLAISTVTASAALTLTFTEENGGVVMRTSGTIDLTNGVLDSDVSNNPDYAGYAINRGIVTQWNGTQLSLDRIIGVDLLAVDMFNGKIDETSHTGGGGFGVGALHFDVFSDGDPNIRDNNMLDVTSYSSTREMTWDGHTFASMGLDAHATNTTIGLWATRAGYTEDEAVNFVVVSAVPEPSSLLLSGLGALSILARRRRVALNRK